MVDLKKSMDITKAHALKFIFLIGITSLFADITYEGARSIIGPFLGNLGANAAEVGFIAGLGELIGYSLRVISGYLVDKTQRYWTITLIGYLLNLLSVPLLALAGYWQVAMILVVLERFGKAIRVPARDAMLSHAGHRLGVGWAFGLHSALDRVGAMTGPLVIALILYYQGSYRLGFALLGFPAILAIITLLIAAFLYPRPKDLEINTWDIEHPVNFKKVFWLYVIAAGFIAAGYADFALIAFHFSQAAIMSDTLIPLSYALAMGFSAILSPVIGHYYDRWGIIVLILVTLLSMCFSPLVFLGNEKIAFIGVILWSLGMIANESLMRAIVANMVPINKRGSAYGFFNLGYGFAWFLGSVILGLLYDISWYALIIFSIGIQIVALPLLWKIKTWTK